MVIRSKKYTDAAKGQSCVHCGALDGTVVAAHYQGIRSLEHGKGQRIKPHDILTADLCRACHQRFDSYQSNSIPLDGIEPRSNRDFVKRVDCSEIFLNAIVRTIIRRVEQGVIKIDGYEISDP